MLRVCYRFLALIALADYALGPSGCADRFVDASGKPTISFTLLLGYAFADRWVIGVPWHEAVDAGKLSVSRCLRTNLLPTNKLGQMLQREER